MTTKIMNTKSSPILNIERDQGHIYFGLKQPSALNKLHPSQKNDQKPPLD